MTATRRFPGWEIIEGAGGGYIAIRAVQMPEHSALSNVRCGATLPELFKHLEEEARADSNGLQGRARDRAG
ncbi:hypothetical protein [Nonomuraea sp. NPDC049695]|uniref:hypothetical protein n=1 Tax=Nonomuraea sp. NPDC049695 TaxID=3154734 RepID=UPI0034319AF6